MAKKLLQRQNIQLQTRSWFTPATNLKIGTYVLKPNFVTQKEISKKLQPNRKRPFQFVDKPTDVTYKVIELKKKLNSSTQKQSFTILPIRTRSSRTNTVILFYRTKGCLRQLRR